MKEEERRKICQIGDAARFAAVLEASTEKPGNVTPTHDFRDATYQDYLAGAIALGSSVEEAACRGFLAGKKEIGFTGVGIGGLIRRGVADVAEAHGGGNTHLGTILLFIPIAAAAGVCLAQGKGFRRLRDNITEVVEASTREDSKNFYAAIRKAGAGGLGKPRVLNVPFRRLMEESAGRDRIAEELSGGMGIIFDVGLPMFEEIYLLRRDLREAILRTYLVILSRYPDTLIAKKKGKEKALEVSRYAAKTLRGEISLEELDCRLRDKKNTLNPGTTADMVAGVTFLWLLKNRVF